MPKNNNDIITKSKARSKSTARKPLRDVSNGVKLSSKSAMKKLSEACGHQVEHQQVNDGDEYGALDRLLLIHSDLSSLVHQIDELVGQALKLTSKKGRKEIESFANVLAEMQNSLEPWVPRFQKALSKQSTGLDDQLEQSVVCREVVPANKTISIAAESPEQTKLDSLVSPSPLVSWRAADCAAEGGRQLFLLTPLPRPKSFSVKYQESSKTMLEQLTSRTSIQPPAICNVAGKTEDDLLEDFAIKPTPNKVPDRNLDSKCISPEKFSGRDISMLAMTPCLKISPPKSCVLLEPISEFPRKDTHGVHRSTPFPTGIQYSNGSQDSASSSSQVSEHLSLKYTEFLGIKLGHNYGNRKKVVEESPNWLMSPPKSCALMEPPDDNLLTNAPSNHPLPKMASNLHHGLNLLSRKENEIQGDHSLTKICKQGLGGNAEIVESTPMLKGPESTFQIGKRPGENTLKKELWTKFEAASTNGIRFDVSVLQKTAQKGFFDRLDEVA